tara:strand:- start:1430 stop:1897 length:468 start_codon:yes stop_codon:yes gene_type:complete
MDPEQTSIKLDVSKWNIRIDQRSRNRMKLQIKLSKDEAQAYKNFAAMCKPEDLSEDMFIKTVFITGFEAMNKELAEMVQKYAAANKEELAASGITVFEDEDGEVRLAETETLNNDLSGADIEPPTRIKELVDIMIEPDATLDELLQSDGPTKYEG